LETGKYRRRFTTREIKRTGETAEEKEGDERKMKIKVLSRP
jgi:hypothetical protein